MHSSTLIQCIHQSAARHLVQHFRRSAKCMTALRRHAQSADTEIKNIEMPIDVSTRWNSTFAMIANLVKNQWIIRSVLADPTIVPRATAVSLELKDNHWSLLREISIILKPFKTASDHLEGSNYVTMSSLLPIAKGLVGQCEELLVDELQLSASKTFCSTILSSLHTRFSDVMSTSVQSEGVSIYHKSTWLNPFHKGKFFSRQMRVSVRIAVETEADTSTAQDESRHGPLPQMDHSQEQMETVNSSSEIHGLFERGLENSGSSSDSESSNIVSEEIAWYLKRKVDEKESPPAPLTWWDNNGARAPLLKRMAVKYLSVPATSAASERAFSSAGLTVSQLRSRLTSAHVNELNFLYCNKKLLE
uniref:zinc finger BED domain-containing protein 4-like isoform X1 n=1 Tax=Styela clava TaxID=7725 RepID=UPI00193AD1D6|nr:zinc finger BED domain-containing protein 4-like isoform X1 [Styela clava]